MSGLITRMFLLDKYGPRLDTKQIGEVLGLSAGAVRNRINAGTIELRTYVDGQRYADYQDVADYLELCRSRASAQAGAGFPA